MKSRFVRSPDVATGSKLPSEIHSSSPGSSAVSIWIVMDGSAPAATIPRSLTTSVRDANCNPRSRMYSSGAEPSPVTVIGVSPKRISIATATPAPLLRRPPHVVTRGTR